MLLESVKIWSQNHFGNMPVINEAIFFLSANQQDPLYVVVGIKNFCL